ncbi:hypothetical protein WV31_17515 [Magnetospirillum sp. ME-1]|nr:hypothetical protein WV31_17515 [Magnetospirillum sp. ME-1]
MYSRLPAKPQGWGISVLAMIRPMARPLSNWAAAQILRAARSAARPTCTSISAPNTRLLMASVIHRVLVSKPKGALLKFPIP